MALSNGFPATFIGWTKAGTRRRNRIEAGWTNKPDWDRGHWTGHAVNVGTKVGTNMSISAKKYLEYKRKTNPNFVLTEISMKAMTVAEALEIYKDQYWDEMRGSDIKAPKQEDAQLIANFIADMKSSGGGEKSAQRALNRMGENLAVDGNIGNLSIAAINKVLAAGKVVELNNLIREEQIKHYKSLSNQASNWYTSLDRDYPELYAINTPLGVKNVSSNKMILITVCILLLVAVGGFYGYKYWKARKN